MNTGARVKVLRHLQVGGSLWRWRWGGTMEGATCPGKPPAPLVAMLPAPAAAGSSSFPQRLALPCCAMALIHALHAACLPACLSLGPRWRWSAPRGSRGRCPPSTLGLDWRLSWIRPSCSRRWAGGERAGPEGAPAGPYTTPCMHCLRPDRPASPHESRPAPRPCLPPQVRLKFRDILSIKALPYPALKIQKRLALPEGSWGVRLRCGRAGDGPQQRQRAGAGLPPHPTCLLPSLRPATSARWRE